MSVTSSDFTVACPIDAKMPPFFGGAAMKCAFGVLLCGLAVLAGAMPLLAQNDLDQRVAKEMDFLVATYKHLHENPELSTQEKDSSALIAAELRKLGYDVTDHFGQYDSPGLVSYGIVGVLRNGAGPTVYVRTDMDALPVVENTALPYASHVKVKRADGPKSASCMLVGTTFICPFLWAPRACWHNSSNNGAAL